MVTDAPGLKRRKLTNGSYSFYWVATNVIKDIGDYPLKTIRLHGTEDEISQRCRILTSELKLWLSEHDKGPRPIYDGTIKSLIAVYRRTEESPYHNVKQNTRRMYDQSLDLLEVTVGARQLSKLTGLDFTRWYNNLKAPAQEGGAERQRRAYKAMQLVRIIIKFGVVADIKDCVRLAVVLQNVEFSVPPSRTQHVTFTQVQAICAKAIANGRFSIALAQALQFELTLRQIDVIGIWENLESGNDQQGIINRQPRTYCTRTSSFLLISRFSAAQILPSLTAAMIASINALLLRKIPAISSMPGKSAPAGSVPSGTSLKPSSAAMYDRTALLRVSNSKSINTSTGICFSSSGEPYFDKTGALTRVTCSKLETPPANSIVRRTTAFNPLRKRPVVGRKSFMPSPQ